jgi:hypothetical protein
MSAVATIPQRVAEIRLTIAGITKSIREAGDPDTIKAQKDKVRMAREWAKIHKIAKEVHADLIRIEIECLRRIGQIDGGLDVLTAAEKAAAKFFASLSESDLEQVIRDFGDRATATGVYRAHVSASEANYMRDLGRKIAKGERPWNGLSDDEKFDEAAERFRYDDIGALAQLVDSYAAQGETLWIEDIADQLIEQLDSEGIEVKGRALREGVREVCRKAVRSGKSITIAGTKAPRFVTCSYEEFDRTALRGGKPDITAAFMRIPFESATLPQLDEMVELRRRQLEEDRAALEGLEKVRDHISTLIQPADRAEVTIGLALARAAVMEPDAERVWHAPERERTLRRSSA